MANENLTNAKRAKNDEFYTQFHDIEKEINAYLEYDSDVFRGKTILCPCDDPYESNFFKYFALNFGTLGLKKLIATCYAGSPISNQELSLFDDESAENKTTRSPHKIEITEIPDLDKDGAVSLADVELLLASDKTHLTRLKGDGDFRSDEIKQLRDEADMIITNPPFSLFREFLAWIVEAEKQFLIIGNVNAITYKEVFPLIKENKMWLGLAFGRDFQGFIVPESYPLSGTEARIDKHGNRIVSTNNTIWFTNLDHGRRHEPIELMTMQKNLEYSRHKEIRGKKSYDQYDNYDAIEVPFTDAIPSDHEGVMGVPVSFLHRYCPEQFDIVGTDYNVKEGLLPELVNPNWKGKLDRGYVDGNRLYSRILIRKRK